MQIRRASPDDAAALVAFTVEIVGEPVSTSPLAPDEIPTVAAKRASIELDAASPRGLALVAEARGQIVGNLTLHPVAPRRALRHVAWLGLSVRASHRRRGIGRALIQEALTWAPTAGITRVELNVYARNVAAIALYEACGFELEGRRRRFVREGNGYLDDLLMARLLD